MSTDRPAIRYGDFADLARLIELATAFWRESIYGRLFPMAPAYALESLVRTALTAGVVFVAEVDGRVVGMLGAVPVTLPLTGEIIVEELAWYVEPAYRSGRTGPLLLTALEDWTYKKGAVVLKMVAPADKPEVAKYYRRHGYTEVEVAYMKRL